MRYFFVASAVILAVVALPTDIDVEPDNLQYDYDEALMDPARHPDGFTTNVNYTTARLPFGQAGFASMNGGTHGGNGGARWTVWDPWALRDAVGGNERREVIIRGRIDLTQMFENSPGVRFNVGNYKTITGQDRNAMIFGGGLVLSGCRQVIVQNIRFHNALNYAPGERPNGSGGIANMVHGPFSTIDSLDVRNNAEYIWINHCEFADDPWIAINTPDYRRRHDGQLDITQGANWVSVNDCIFRNHNFVSLVGNSDNNAAVDRNRLKVTWYNNWFQGVNQRCPFVRYGEVHVVNNLYTDIGFYGVGVGTEGRVYTERNMFINCNRAWTGDTPSGAMQLDNNWLVSSGFLNPPSLSVSWRPYHYYRFVARAAAAVEAHVRRFAGPR